jgi:hypothetical protein
VSTRASLDGEVVERGGRGWERGGDGGWEEAWEWRGSGGRERAGQRLGEGRLGEGRRQLGGGGRRGRR